MTHKNLDFHDINSRALAVIESILAAELPDGKRQGGEYTAINPTRPDSSHGSFKINLRTGAWSDFATGDKGGDIISLYAYLHGISQSEAAEKVAEITGSTPPQKRRQTPKDRESWTPILPVPDNAPEPMKAHHHYGPPSKTWAYRDSEGRLLGYVWRIDRAGKNKEILPLTFCRSVSGKREWRFRSWNTPRPLYGLDRLAANPHSPVLVVEGEKCADAGAAYLKRYAVIAWPGGAKAVKKIDWSPLEGRKIVLWPDADADHAGFLAMFDLYEEIKGRAEIVKLMEVPDGTPNKWDIADAVSQGWDTRRIEEYIVRQARDPESLRETVGRIRERKKTPSTNSDVQAAAETIVRQFGKNGDYSFTDTGNARRLADMFGDEIRYNDKPFGKWFIWDGCRWCEDKTKKIYHYVDKVVNDLHRQAAEADDTAERKKLAKWALSLEAWSRQRAMVSKAETIQDIAILADELDRDMYLFNTRNCTLDLASGDVIEKKDHDPNDHITKLADVEYDEDAECPKWEKFIGEIFEGNEEVIPFLKRAVGYSLTADISGQIWLFAYGTGANGKSLFFNTIEMILGDYFRRVSTEMIMAQKFAQHPTEIVDLKGARFVVCSEVEDGRRFAEARIKDLTGYDGKLKGRRMREDNIEFTPTHTMWLFGNHKPEVRGTDEAIWRRIRIVPFTVTIPEKERRPMSEMLAEFRKEKSGILNWMLDGYLDYRENGFREPPAVLEAIQDYREEMDVLGRFIDEYCFVSSQVSIPASQIWKVYHGWCDDNGEHAMSSKKLNASLRERGFMVRKSTGNVTYVFGIALKAEMQCMQDS